MIDLTMGQNVMNGLQRKSWKNLHALNEWRIHLKKKDSLTTIKESGKPIYFARVEQEYLWNDEFQTFESTAFGHPANPKLPKKISPLGRWAGIDFKINFENDGLSKRQGSNGTKDNRRSLIAPIPHPPGYRTLPLPHIRQGSSTYPSLRPEK